MKSLVGMSYEVVGINYELQSHTNKTPLTSY